MARRTPEEIDRLTPREAYQAGREDLAESMQRDALAAKASESATAKAQLDERLTAIERRLKAREDDAEDRARSIADHGRRLAEVERRIP